MVCGWVFMGGIRPGFQNRLIPFEVYVNECRRVCQLFLSVQIYFVSRRVDALPILTEFTLP